MRIPRTFVAGVAGLAVGAGAAIAAGAVGVAHPPPAAEPSSGARDERSGDALPRATLAAGAPTVPAAAAVLAIDLADWIEKGVPTLRQDQHVERTLWQTVAASYARLNRPAEVLRVCEAGLAAGGNGGDCTWPLSELSDAVRGGVLAALRARHPDLAFDGMLLARAAAAAGDRAAAFRAALEVFRAMDDRWLAAVEAMARADPRRSEAVLADSATKWTSASLLAAAGALRNAGAEDLAAPWRVRGERLQAEEEARAASQALEDARRRTAQTPRDPDPWVDLAQALLDAGDRAGAFEAYRRAVELDPYSADSWASLVGLDAAAARPLLAEAAPRVERDDVWVELTRACLAVGRGDDAVDAFLRIHSEDYDEWWDHGLARVAPAKALPWLEARLQIPRYSTYGSFLIAYADALLAVGRRAEAWDVADRLFEDGGQDAAWRRRIDADPPRALTAIEEHLRKEPNSDSALRSRPVALAAVGRKEEAIAAYEPHAVRGDEDAIGALAALGSARWLAFLEEWARKQPDEASWTQRLAEAYRALGREAEAREAFARAAPLCVDSYPWLIRHYFAH